jgi:hypothetical protein
MKIHPYCTEKQLNFSFPSALLNLFWGNAGHQLKAKDSKGIGIKNQIVGLLKDISCREFFFELAMLF